MSPEEFIETPSQNFTPEDLKRELAGFLPVLNGDSARVVDIIRESFCSASYLLHDLATKMKSQQCLQQFAILYDNHLTELVDLSIYSWHDLQRFISNYPDYLEKIMDNVSDNEACLQRLLSDTSHSEDILENIKAANPDYEFPSRFSELFLPECRMSFR